jgi:hypothetical protein
MGVPAGWKDFTSSILTTEDVNDYLMSQSVMVFDSDFARTSELGTPSEGMIAYLRDTNLLQFFDGTNWQSIAIDRVLKSGDEMTGALSIAMTLPSLNLADRRTSVGQFQPLGSVMFSTNRDGANSTNAPSASISALLYAASSSSDVGLDITTGTRFARSSSLQISPNGQVTSPRNVTYNGDNTGGGYPTFNGESVRPPTTYMNVGGAFNASNGRFTLPANAGGHVLCSFNSLMLRPSAVAHAYVEFQVNGVRKSVRTHTIYDIGGNYQTLNNTAIVYCNGGDFVTCNLWTVSGAAAYADIYGLGLTFRYLG